MSPFVVIGVVVIAGALACAVLDLCIERRRLAKAARASRDRLAAMHAAQDAAMRDRLNRESRPVLVTYSTSAKATLLADPSGTWYSKPMATFNIAAAAGLIMQAALTYETATAEIAAGQAVSSSSVQVGSDGTAPIYATLVFSPYKNPVITHP